MTVNRSLSNLWNHQHAAALNEAELLCYRSNLLGSDKRITNFGGGNTSAKILETDPLSSEQVEVLWVKGSGGDLGSISLDGFSTLYLNKLEGLKSKYRGIDFEDEMVGYLPHCTFNLNPRAASIDTPLHAYVPYKHVDHVHSDAIIAIAASLDSERLTKEIFNGRIGWLPWQRPGYDLGLKLEAEAKNPNLVGLILGGHGLFTWHNTAVGCYETTLEIINLCSDWLAAQPNQTIFGGAIHTPLEAAQRQDLAATLLPVLRGKISILEPKIGHFTDSVAVLEFVCSANLGRLAALGTSCPDHFLRTKIAPLVLDFDPQNLEALDAQLEAYRQFYSTYYERCHRQNSPAMRDPNAVVYLIPSVGMLTFAKDKATARIAAEYYENAINVMREAERVSQYVGLDEQEAFDIEYWLLEEAKLQRQPKPKALAGKIALVTGGAGGIGRATAIKLLESGASVVLADIDQTSLQAAVEQLATTYSFDMVRGVQANMTLESDVISSVRCAALEYGGLDILVSNAGIASSAAIEETSLELWNKNISVLTTGYFLISREATKLLKAQKLGGSIIFVASKNALVASPNASAYCTAKAAELHLARCLALELAQDGVRVNSVNPDAVLRGSKIWTGEWKTQRAAAYNIEETDLEELYRNRSLLKLGVYPEDIAEGIYFFATQSSSKSTGNILNVDAGHAGAFTR